MPTESGPCVRTVSAMRAAASATAASQAIGCAAVPRARRCIGCSSRVAIVTGALAVRCSVLPLVQSRPKLAG